MRLFTTSFLIVFILINNINNLFAQNFQLGIANRQDQVIQNQQRLEEQQKIRQKLRQQKYDRDLYLRKQKRKSNSKKIIHNKPEIIQDYSDIQCFRIKKIKFNDNLILNEKEQEILVSDYLNRCLVLEQIEILVKEVTSYLLQKDYVTSKAILSKQEISDGELEIKIVEGMLEDLVINDESFADNMQKFSAFGLVDFKKPLNIKNISVGLDVMNRLSSNQAFIKIVPGSIENHSIIYIQNDSKDKLNISLSYDDYGSEITGKNRETINISYDNLLNLNDNFNISRSANELDDKNDIRRNEFIALNYSIAYKRFLLNLGYSDYEYLFFAGENLSSRFDGTSTSREIGLDYLLTKKEKYKITLNSNLINRKLANYQDDALIEVSSRTSSNASFGVLINYFSDKFALFVNPSYVRGLTIFDGLEDPKDILNNEPRSEFELYKIYLNYSYDFFFKKIDLPVNYNLVFDSQFSKDKLYSNEHIFAGGPFSVRGFEEGSISGDSGYFMQNNFTINLKKLFNLFSNKTNIKFIDNNLYKFSLAPFYDYGFVKNKATYGINSGRVSSFGASLSYDSKYFSANLTYGAVDNKSALLFEDKKENHAIYFNISTDFSFL